MAAFTISGFAIRSCVAVLAVTTLLGVLVAPPISTAIAQTEASEAATYQALRAHTERLVRIRAARNGLIERQAVCRAFFGANPERWEYEQAASAAARQKANPQPQAARAIEKYLKFESAVTTGAAETEQLFIDGLGSSLHGARKIALALARDGQFDAAYARLKTIADPLNASVSVLFLLDAEVRAGAPKRALDRDGQLAAELPKDLKTPALGYSLGTAATRVFDTLAVLGDDQQFRQLLPFVSEGHGRLLYEALLAGIGGRVDVYRGLLSSELAKTYRTGERGFRRAIAQQFRDGAFLSGHRVALRAVAAELGELSYLGSTVEHALIRHGVDATVAMLSDIDLFPGKATDWNAHAAGKLAEELVRQVRGDLLMQLVLASRAHAPTFAHLLEALVEVLVRSELWEDVTELLPALELIPPLNSTILLMRLAPAVLKLAPPQTREAFFRLADNGGVELKSLLHTWNDQITLLDTPEPIVLNEKDRMTFIGLRRRDRLWRWDFARYLKEAMSDIERGAEGVEQLPFVSVIKEARRTCLPKLKPDDGL